MPDLDLGPARDRRRPEPVEVGGRRVFIVGPANAPRVFSDACPHMGGRVELEGEEYVCPLHRWRFRFSDGGCTSAPGQSLREYSVRVEAGRVLVDLPDPQRVTLSGGGALQGAPVSIALRAHAALEITANPADGHDAFELLTDPWLDGPAFLGSWIQYPHVPVDPSALKPSAIWISHEHSDHFHEPTLLQMDRSIPVYVPDFPNRRLPDRLVELGFESVTALAFGEPCELAPDFTITVYEPESLWNDAILLVETRGVRLLNLNDAGLNSRIAKTVGPVDVVASAFTPGASSYPLAWTHLSLEEKREILERSRAAMLEMLRRAVDLYGAQHVLPFAGHFALLDPAHEDYLREFRKNSIDDVMEAFEGTSTRVLDLLPGESFDAASGAYERIWVRRERLPERVFSRVQRERERWLRPDESVDLASEEVEAHLLRFNDTLEIQSCEALSVDLKWTGRSSAGSTSTTRLRFEVRDSALQIGSDGSRVDLAIELPERILAAIVRDGASWDEAHIGYWCTLTRDPDVYHAGFWRMLQAPRALGELVGEPSEAAPDLEPPRTEADHSGDRHLRGESVRSLLDQLGDLGARILHRAGLYCSTCARAEADTLDAAARCHGLGEVELERLERELSAARSACMSATREATPD